MENCESLPDGIQHLASLSRLELSHFDMQELPEWFGDLTSLQELYVIFCEKLKCMPSLEAMRRLTKLTTLEISECPLLEKRCRQQSDVDSEWPKISHIPNISIDYDFFMIFQIFQIFLIIYKLKGLKLNSVAGPTRACISRVRFRPI
ncbi:hypothetical protein ACS0TY_033214 [Phlomoides rotata]